MANLITIDQLLESVDLDFEPRFVTKDADGWISFFPDAPINIHAKWIRKKDGQMRCISPIKLSEFADKDWQECIYEVPRKIDKQNLEKLRPADSDLVYRVKLPRKTTTNSKKELVGNIEPIYVPRGEDFAGSGVYAIELAKRLNQVIDAVNELKEK